MDRSETTKPSLRDFLHIVFKRKIQILGFFCATLFVVILVTVMWKPTYEASSQILVKVGRENVYLPATGDGSPVVRVDREEQINSEIEILKGRSLAEEVAKSIGPTAIYTDLREKKESSAQKVGANANLPEILVNEATQNLQEDLGIKGIKKSNVIEVSFKHHNPQMAARVVNDLVRFFLDRHLEVHKSPGSYKFFKEQSHAYKDKLMQTENRLHALKKEYEVTSLEQEFRLYLAQEANLKDELNKTIVQEAETRNRVIEIRQQLSSTPKTISMGREVEQNPYLINTLEERLVELELKKTELSGKYTDENRLVRNVKGEIQLVRNKLKEQETKRYGKATFGLNTIHQRLQEQLYQNEADLKAFSAKKIAQTAQLADYRTKIENLNRIEMKLRQLQNQLEIDQKNYRLYLTKFEESRISNAMDAEKIVNVSVLEPATPPLKPVSPKISLNIALGAFLGIFGGLFLAFCMEYLDDSLDRPEAVEQSLNLPVLVSMPELKA